MPSKILDVFVKTSLLSVLLFVVSCSYFFEEKVEEAEIVYHLEVGDCMADSNQLLTRYFNVKNEELVPKESFTEISKCYQNAIATLVEKTVSGRLESENYSAENIHTLITKFSPDIKLSIYQIENFIKIKYFLIGGSTETVSKKEFKTVYNLIPEFTDLLYRVQEQKVLVFGGSQTRKSLAKYHKSKKSHEHFQNEVGKFINKIDRYSGDRSLRLETLFGFVVSEFVKDENEERIYGYRSIVLAFKNLVLNDDDDDRLNRKDLATFVNTSLKSYELIQNFNTFMLDTSSRDSLFGNLGGLVSFFSRMPALLKYAKVFQGVELHVLMDSIEMAETILLVSAERDQNDKIAFNRLENFTLALEDVGVMKSRLSATTLNRFMSVLSEKWLDPVGVKEPHITSAKIHHIKALFNKWVRKQNIINTSFYGKGDVRVAKDDFFVKKTHDPLVSEWSQLYSSVSTQIWDDNGFIRFKGSRWDTLSYEGLTVSNSLSLLIELFTKPYNLKSASLHLNSVTKEQAQEVYELLRILGVELAFMDSRVDDSGIRAFREANSFMTQKRSDDVMDFYEIYEYLSASVSSGNLSDYIYSTVPAVEKLSYRDTLHSKVFNTNFFRNHLSNNFGDFFESLDSVSEYWQNSSSKNRKKFLGYLESASRGGVHSQKPYDLNEVRFMVMILHYMEAIFTTYDTDGDGKLAGEEVAAAEPHFRKLVKNFIADNRPDVLKNKWVLKAAHNTLGSVESGSFTDDQILEWFAPKIFIHLLWYGYLPQGQESSLITDREFLKLLNNSDYESEYDDISVDIQVMTQVFAALSKITRQGHVNRIYTFLLDSGGVYSHISDDSRGLLIDLDLHEAPNCSKGEAPYFCKWARLIFCNETVNPELFTWMKRHRGVYANKVDWQEHPEKSAKEAIAIFSQFFRFDELFSTQCGFPEVSDDTGFSYLGKNVVSTDTVSETADDEVDEVKEEGDGGSLWSWPKW